MAVWPSGQVCQVRSGSCLRLRASCRAKELAWDQQPLGVTRRLRDPRWPVASFGQLGWYSYIRKHVFTS